MWREITLKIANNKLNVAIFVSIMIALIVATIATALFTILFKVFQLKGINGFYAILINYVVAFLWGCLLSFQGIGISNPIKEEWLPLAIAVGLIFILGMVALDTCTDKVGVSVSTVSSRASMVISIIICYFLIPGSDRPNWIAILIVILSLAMILDIGKGRVSGRKSGSTILWTAIVFVMFGLSNAMLKVMQYKIGVAYSPLGGSLVSYMNALATSVIFISALVFGLIMLIVKPAGKRARFTGKDILGGTILGTANFFATFLLIEAMKSIDSAILFPAHNAGIVAIGAIVGWKAFKEPRSWMQIAGMILATGAIVWLCI